MSDILVIKCNAMVKPETLKQLRQKFMKEKEDGVIVLPAMCEAIIAPDDVEIVMKNKNDIICFMEDKKCAKDECQYKEVCENSATFKKENTHLEEKYKTCGRYTHESDPNIKGSFCYLCRRNTTDNRIDWFEEKKEKEECTE